MLTIKKYTPSLKADWDTFVDTSKNGTFLLRRDYMEYHSDRFTDFSLLIYNERRLVGLFVASLHDGGRQAVCHGGLTYGGLILPMRATVDDVAQIFDALRHYMANNGVGEVVYKAIPYIYHKIPAEEDLYVMFAKCGAKLVRRDISSVVDFSNQIKIRRIRECGHRTAINSGLTAKISTDIGAFWDILNETLNSRHNVAPVHSKEELRLLSSRFPEEIKLVAAYNTDGKMVAGTLLFLTPTCVHSQYIAANDEGRHHGALDLIFLDILASKFEVLNGRRYFDFGRSTESDGTVYNASLLYQKEGFGARGVCYDTYRFSQ